MLDETGVELKNLAVAPGGIVEKVYPLEGNESLIGFNFMDPERPGNLDAIEAYNSGRTVITNPFDLVQGGKGIAGRAPVMIVENGAKRLWGLITVTIDYDQLIETFKLDNFTNMGYNYSLSYVDSAGSETVMKQGGNISSNAVSIEFNLRNRSTAETVLSALVGMSLWCF